MRKDIRYTIILVIMILLALLCLYRILADKEIEGEQEPPAVTGEGAIPTERIIIIPDKDSDSNVVLGTISFYKVNLSSRIIESVEVAAQKEAEVTPKLVAEYITDALEDEEIDLEIIGIVEKDGVCFINFSDDINDIADKDPELEKMILDAYAMSIVDNCKVDGVTFKIDGKTYSTKNRTLKDGEVYLKN